MASMSVSPELSQPTTLLTHPASTPAELARHAALSATGFSTTKVSNISIGTAFKLSSDARVLRRLKGTLPILVAGNALNLINPQNQTPIQSFALSSAETASSAPLTLLRSLGNGRSLRTTYVGIESHTRTKSGRAAVTATHQLWAYIEELSAKGKESVGVQVKKESLFLDKPIRLIHAFCDGRLVLTHVDDSLTIVDSSPVIYDDDASVAAATSSMQVIDTIESIHSQSQQRSHFYVNVLDPGSAKRLIAGSSSIEEAALIGLRVAVTSDNRATSPSAQANRDSNKHKKRSKRSKRGGNEGRDDDDIVASISSSISASCFPSGPLSLELTAFVKSFDGASDSAIASVRLGHVKIPHSSNARNVLDVQVHPDGRLVILSAEGKLACMTLGTSSSGEPLLSSVNTTTIDALAHVGTARSSSSSTASPSSCLLLSRDHALLVGVTNCSPSTAVKERLVALVVDLELNAVLRQIDFAVPFVPAPSAATWSTSLLQRMTTISASRIAGSTSVITIGPPTVASGSPSSSDKTEALSQLQQRRTCVLSVSFVVPEMSVLRDALGKGELTARWLRSSDFLPAHAEVSDESRSQLLTQIKKIAQSDGKGCKNEAEVTSAISNLIEVATADGRMLETLTSPEADTLFFGELIDVLLPAALQRKSKSNGASGATLFSRAGLLTLLKDERVHPSIFGSLKLSANGNAVSEGSISVQVNGAGFAEFWSRLEAHNDAQLICAALNRIREVGEETLVSLMTSALRGLVQSRQSEDADLKTAESFLRLLVQLVQERVSRPALRKALKVQLRDDVDQVMALLQICNAWMSQNIQHPLQAEQSGSEVKGDEEEIAVAAGQVKVPHADAVMAFANDVLDTFFPLLLATSRSHVLVQCLSCTISRYVEMMSSLRLLNAPLSAFAKLEEENELMAASVNKNKNKNKSCGMQLSMSGALASAGNAVVSVSSKVGASARAEMGGGLGVKLGTQGEAKTRRLEFLEQSMLVGAYSFERLEI
ncbi:uncharacterized protein MEPE_04666 [Melanopsichium pennsylvanicum]|uniref:Uncharacterized protein n=2 Tax=Melanopsichium pennsylvanicum TaxID=63383 RepID=A0AAJ4XPF0_9BASI|nr:putative protein [Melanopsichium pennsylvanicum 4]SNX85957.1 uncharacterized protein MEPE_04666 [Melanopsichium pennsylvanicum]